VLSSAPVSSVWPELPGRRSARLRRIYDTLRRIYDTLRRIYDTLRRIYDRYFGERKLGKKK
jgi:hypothetical protein